MFSVSWALWRGMDLLPFLKARVSTQVERLGQDTAELGMESYPEFVLMPDAEELEDD